MKLKDVKEFLDNPIVVTIIIVSVTLAVVLPSILPNPDQPPMEGKLSYREDLSNPTNGKAVFNITLSQPSKLKVEKLNVLILNTSGLSMSNFTESEDDTNSNRYTWVHVVSDEQRVMSGDRLSIIAEDGEGNYWNISGFKVVLKCDGYCCPLGKEIP